MNLEYGQSNSTLDRLIAANSEAMEEIGRTPYQPIVYAIPEQQLAAVAAMLKAATEFQPTLYRMLSPLATAEDIDNLTEKSRSLLAEETRRTAAGMKAENAQTLQKIELSLSQAGSNQEKFISALSAEAKECKTEIKLLSDTISKRMTRLLISVSLSAAMLSALVCALFWKLLL